MLQHSNNPEKEIQIKYKEVNNNQKELNLISSEKVNKKQAIYSKIKSIIKKKIKISPP